jgi:penicillin V acylase-like amidase (Ntn superfamily)
MFAYFVDAQSSMAFCFTSVALNAMLQTSNAATVMHLAIFFLLLEYTMPCTSTQVNLSAGAGSSRKQYTMSARTLDDTPVYVATLEVNPRGKEWVSDAPAGAKQGLQWVNKYGFVGATWSSATPGCYDDGMNEHGLSVAQACNTHDAGQALSAAV